MSNLIAYHGDPAIKERYLARVREHARLDHLVQGTGWENGRGCAVGCAVGCTLEAYDHSRYPIELGIPEWLAYLEDRIFEGLPWGEARSWPERFLVAIPVGADLEPVRWQQAIWRHTRQLDALKDNDPQVRDAIRLVIDYCRARLDGTATEKQRNAAAAAARSAMRSARSAASAAESAEWSAESVAWSAAESAAAAAAAWSAASAAAAAWSAASAAWSEHWHDEAEHLLALLANAQVPNREGTK